MDPFDSSAKKAFDKTLKRKEEITINDLQTKKPFRSINMDNKTNSEKEITKNDAKSISKNDKNDKNDSKIDNSEKNQEKQQEKQNIEKTISEKSKIQDSNTKSLESTNEKVKEATPLKIKISRSGKNDESNSKKILESSSNKDIQTNSQQLVPQIQTIIQNQIIQPIVQPTIQPTIQPTMQIPTIINKKQREMLKEKAQKGIVDWAKKKDEVKEIDDEIKKFNDQLDETKKKFVDLLSGNGEWKGATYEQVELIKHKKRKNVKFNAMDAYGIIQEMFGEENLQKILVEIDKIREEESKELKGSGFIQIRKAKKKTNKKELSSNEIIKIQ
jgi:hypothetical protein